VSATLYGVGVGPGDPELITLKAARLIAACPIVAYPAPEHGESLARRIAAAHLTSSHTEIAIRMPLVAERFPAEAVFAAAARDLVAHLDVGRDVAVLCLGDPLLYGSFQHLFGRLGSTHSIVVVPGITSTSAAAARLGFVLGTRNDVVSIVPATLPDDEIVRRLASCETAAIVKLGRHFGRVRELLRARGWLADARYAEHLGMESERIVAIDAVDPARVPYFSILLVRGGAPSA
jgi:precorrin-2/cobalt-factor-2 C20-methyltransferase